MSECVFCKIVARQIPCTVVYETEQVLAFKDAAPQAPHHILIVPKKHHPNLDEMDPELMGLLLAAARDIAKQNKWQRNGYRLVINTGRDGGQSVFHLHVHLLAGRPLAWPPG